ncbi:unnamed protein product [Spodoptera exigua]|nr:unnamed protein product [Spodoptera exigua]
MDTRYAKGVVRAHFLCYWSANEQTDYLMVSNQRRPWTPVIPKQLLQVRCRPLFDPQPLLRIDDMKGQCKRFVSQKGKAYDIHPKKNKKEKEDQDENIGFFALTAGLSAYSYTLETLSLIVLFYGISRQTADYLMVSNPAIMINNDETIMMISVGEPCFGTNGSAPPE